LLPKSWSIHGSSKSKAKCEERCRQCEVHVNGIRHYVQDQQLVTALRVQAVWADPRTKATSGYWGTTVKKVGTISGVIAQEMQYLASDSVAVVGLVAESGSLSRAIDRFVAMADRMNDFSENGMGTAVSTLIGIGKKIDGKSNVPKYKKVIASLGLTHVQGDGRVEPVTPRVASQDIGYIRKFYTDMAGQYSDLEKYCGPDKEKGLPGDLSADEVKRLKAATAKVFDAAFKTSR